MGTQVVMVFYIEKVFTEIGDYGIFVLCFVFRTLLNGRFPHLKRQVKIIFLFSISIYKGLFKYFILLSLVFG
jgi:hypothetical protein